jgi:UDP-GlcNAc:undecaprenyl-phosphate/decaprenyl-phosphate GlcNAc-1-phosphate transferase
MPQLFDLLLKPALIAVIITFSLTPIIIKYAGKLGILDNPQKRKHPANLHTQPTPRGGGIPIFIGIAVVSLLLLPFDQRLVGILLGALVVVTIGFLDDRQDASPYLRLFGQFLAALIVVLSGIGISFVTNPLGGGIMDLSQPRIILEMFGTHGVWLFSAGFALIWIVALMNAVSWSSGVDGQLSGFASISALTIAILSFSFSADITQWPVTILAAATFGAFLGFLPWHIHPQKIMPGFGGGTLAGFMLAVLSILTTTKVGTLLVVLAIPMADAGYAIIRRSLSGKSPVWGDRKHLHHRLLDAGWNKKRIAYLYWGATAILGVLALNLNSTAKFYTIVGIVLFVGAIFICLNSFLQLQKPQDRDSG